VVVVTSSVDVLEGWNSSFLDWRHEADTENWFICLILEMGKMPLDIGVSPRKMWVGYRIKRMDDEEQDERGVYYLS